MATLRPQDVPGVQLPLFGEDRLKAEIRFNGYSGWEWLVQHRVEGFWYVLDSGLSDSWNSCVHRTQECIGQLDTRD